jgi:hypothetical protein
MILGKNYLIRPVTWEGKRPIDIAQEHYRKKSAIQFELELADYLRNGVVVANPEIFGMAKVIDLAPSLADPPEFVWFVRYACGPLAQLLAHLPYELPKIAFCRHQDGKLRSYSLRRMLALAEVQREREKEKEEETSNG